MVKQDEALFNREEVPETRTEKFKTRDGMTKTNLKPRIKSFGAVVFKNFFDKDSGKHRVHEKPEIRSVMVDIIDASMLDMEYEAGARVHQGRELNMNEKPELREGMLETNLKGKHDDNIMNENGVAAPTEERQLQQ
jgi:hypothetical protein